jgi:hypothetical protein
VTHVLWGQAAGRPAATHSSLRCASLRATRGVACVLLCALLIAGGVIAHAEDPAPLVRESSLGPVRVRVALEPAKPRIGDPLTLRIEASAEPGVELLMPEFGEALERFRVSEFVPSEEIDASGRTIARQVYRLQTERSGAQRIPPIALEFVDRRPNERPAPEGADAYELVTESIEFEVDSVLPEGAALELRPAKRELEPLSSGSGWLWTLVILALLAAAGGPYAWRALAAQRARVVRRSAYDVARAELDALLRDGRPSAERVDPFFVALSSIVRRYVEARFQLRSPELTTEEFLDVLSDSPELGREHQQLLQDFLRNADLVKFAHHVPDAATIDASIAAAERFLGETRETQEAAPSGSAREEPAHA